MEKFNINETIKYWQTSSERDLSTMLDLFKIKRYPEALFFGHLTTEKILKALVAKNTKKHAPPIHNLLRLLEISETKLQEKQINKLSIINKFNIKSRYPDYKLKFHQECNKEYANEYVIFIQDLHKDLCQKLNLSE